MKAKNIGDLKKICCMRCAFNAGLNFDWGNSFTEYRFHEEKILIPCDLYQCGYVVAKGNCQFFILKEYNYAYSRIPFEIYKKLNNG